MNRLFAAVGMVCVVAGAALAHRPQLVYDRVLSTGTPYVISDPDLSEAFYGRLKGTTEYYTIVATYPFTLYLNILSPDISTSSAQTDFKVRLGKDIVLKRTSGWKPFYEEYAGDRYWMGPETRRKLSSGTYVVEVFSAKNRGKYVLAVGETEKFNMLVWLKVLWDLPRYKVAYFEKNILGVFEGKVGRWLVLTFTVLAVLIAVFAAFLKKRY